MLADADGDTVTSIDSFVFSTEVVEASPSGVPLGRSVGGGASVGDFILVVDGRGATFVWNWRDGEVTGTRPLSVLHYYSAQPSHALYLDLPIRRVRRQV
jgi:hypothetical protein